MKTSFLLLFSLFFVAIVNAQSADLPEQLTGSVTDATGQGLPSTQLILKNDDKIIGFGMTDADGKYTIKLPATTVATTLLEARYFGYAVKFVPASAWGNGSDLTIILTEENVELREVVVSADALPQVIKDDTISFKTSAYRDGTEDKIEDVIAKLPGVEVKDNGDITVDGKPLDRILLDGDDVFDRNYKTLSRNVPAGYVEQIDVLSNYQPDQLTGDLNGTGETVMDLRLDPAAKSVVFGEVNLSGGTEEYRHVETNLFMLRRKAKLVNFGRYTTTGGDASPGSSLQHRTAGSPGSIGTINAPVLSSAATRQNRLVPTKDYLQNQGFGMAQSLLLTPTPHLRNRLIVNIGRDTSELQENRSRELITDAGTNGFRLDGKYRLDRLNLWLKNDFNLLLGEQTRLDIEASVIKQRTLAGIDVISTDLTSGISEQTTTDLRSAPLTYDATIRLVRRINQKMAFTAEGNLIRENFDQFQAYQGSVYNDLLQSNALTFGQTLDRVFSGKGLRAVLLQRAGKQRFRYTLAHRSERTETIANLTAIGQNESPPTLVNFPLQTTFSEINWNYKPQKWTLNAMARGNHFRLPYRIGAATEPVRSRGKFAPELSFSMNRKLTRRSSLNAGAHQTFRPVSPDQAIPVTYLSGQTSVTAGLDSAFLLRAISADLGYRYNNTFREYGYGVRINHTIQPNAVFQQLTAEDFLFVSRITPGGRSAVTSATADAAYTLQKTSTRLSARASVFRFADQVAFTGTPLSSVTNSVSTEVTANIPISDRINFYSLVKWQYFATNLEGEKSEQQQLYLRHSLVYRITPVLQAVTKYRTFFPQIGTQQEVVHLLSQDLKYKPKDKPYSLGLQVINLFDQAAVTERNIDPYLRTSRSYQLRPRTLFLYLSYKF